MIVLIVLFVVMAILDLTIFSPLFYWFRKKRMGDKTPPYNDYCPGLLAYIFGAIAESFRQDNEATQRAARAAFRCSRENREIAARIMKRKMDLYESILTRCKESRVYEKYYLATYGPPQRPSDRLEDYL